ncbi:PEP-CTERM sorting domain-containing protein [Aliiglaciecola lipolytica]|uniref:Ice-binding protein C-terminal domain-containing protein n=1 Tax=Aliiglaciecola lipolytica E3 TaxID=1127673 RepID=K6YWK9_9ALTE|nr:PEP-CTERM sorting domain-containing protein [Aliiglaciecola lipolytica]GAC15635.1 hypothetical protein GLIP_3014 [Aliiglaciecola lipolytica E3]
MDTFFKPLIVLFLLFMHGPLHASIIAVLTESTAMGTFRDDVDGNPITVNYSGSQINETAEIVDGSSAIFDSTSSLGEDVIFFQNGNASYGSQALSVSRTVVDISFENTGSTSIRPTLNSQITPAGLGIYVSGCGGRDLRTCELRDDGDYDWQDVGNEVAPGEAAVGSYFDFKVVSGEDVLFELTGGLSLIIGENGNPNTIVQDFDGVENFLTNFRQTSPEGTEQQISFDWEATDFLVEFPEWLTLDPGETGTLSYITEVTTFSNAFCYGEGRTACPIAFGAFGDPIGRGGSSGSRPPESERQLFATQTLPDSVINGIDIGLYEFNIPSFENGEIGFKAISGPGITPSVSVPEPTTITLLMLGTAFFTMRRKRPLN